MQRTPLPPELSEIIEQFVLFDSYAQSSAQSVWADTDAIGLIVFAVALVIFFIASKVQRKC